MSHSSSTPPSTAEAQPGRIYHSAGITSTLGSSEGSSQPLTSRSESMLRSSLTISDETKPSTSTTHLASQIPGSSWHTEGARGYQMTDRPAFHDAQQNALLMGNKYAGENVRSHAPQQPSSAPRNPEREITERTRKDDASGGGSASTASSGVGSESPGKNSPGAVRGSSDTAEWLAQIGSQSVIGSSQLHHGRPVVTVGVTLSSDVVNQAQLAPTTLSSADQKHYYSPKDVVYASTSLSPVTLSSLQYSTHATPSTVPVTLSSLQYSTHATPSTVHLTTDASYSPYLSPYALPYVGYPPSALTPGIESYSAMLASMGNQVQQAQAHLPASPFLTPGALAIPSPYTTLGIPGLTPSASSKGSLSESANSAAAVAYIGGHVIPSPALLPTSHALSTALLSSGLAGGHVPGTSFKTEGHIPRTSFKTEDRLELSQSQVEMEQQRHDQELKRYMESSVKHGGPREARVSPFERRTSPKSEHHTGRDSGVPESPRQLMDLSPSGKADPLRQQYYREIGTVKQEPGDDGHAPQTYLTSRTDISSLHREHTQGMRTHNYSKSNVLSRSPPIASPIPATLHMTSRLAPSRHSPQTGLVLSPAPQVRPTPTISSTSQPTLKGTAIQHELNPPVQTKLESHRFASTVHVAQDQQRPHVSSSDQPSSSGQISQSPVTNVPSYFTRGSIIQLANGELRRVEDLRTEDFVQSADLTEGLKIDSSTVLRVEEDHRRGVAHIGFLVGEQKAQVTVEAPMEHPFFVFGQGWSAVQPDRSLKSYALACHHLAVGDVCVSLTVKENGRQPTLRKEHVLEKFHLSRDLVREPEVKRLRTEISLRQSPVEKTPPLAQSAYHRQTTEGVLPSNHIPGYQGHFASHSDSGTSRVAEQPQPLSKINERVEVDKNANTVIIQTPALSGKQSPLIGKVSEQQIARPLKRRWSDPVQQAADPNQHKDSLPTPVHPDMLMKQSGGH